MLVLVSLLVLGGVTTQWFVVALIVGTVVGTYSSIFVAPPVLYYLAKIGK
jgi:preprotein translocase subunit SecF